MIEVKTHPSIKEMAATGIVWIILIAVSVEYTMWGGFALAVVLTIRGVRW